MNIVSKLSVIVLTFILACGTTGAQRGPLEQAACQLVTAFGGTPQEEAICASSAQLLELAAIVAESQMKTEMADAGARKAAPKAACKVIPTTSVCATDPELAHAIETVKAGK